MYSLTAIRASNGALGELLVRGVNRRLLRDAVAAGRRALVAPAVCRSTDTSHWWYRRPSSSSASSSSSHITDHVNM